MRAAVIGLGKVGLPLAVRIASAGIETTGSDASSELIAMVQDGVAPFPGEAGLQQLLREVVTSGRLRTTVDNREAVSSADAVVVVVPLRLDSRGEIDFAALDAATADVGSTLGIGMLVSYETTFPVGTTRSRIAPALQAKSGLRPGEDFHLVYSPERVSSGRVLEDLATYPKLVGGIDTPSTNAGVRFYESFLDFEDRLDLEHPNGVWPMESAEAAELTKLAETTYRDINIAFANELARHAEQAGIDVWRVVAAANSQPFSHIHRPGVAVGGHCIPVYPHLYQRGDPEATLPMAARAVNESVPDRVVCTVDRSLGGLGGKTIAILGAAYRGDVKETSMSGVFPLAEAIERSGGTPVVNDPLFSDAELEVLGLVPFALGTPCDAAILQADHIAYRTLAPGDLPGCRVIYDGRGVLDPDPWRAASVECITIGRPSA